MVNHDLSYEKRFLDMLGYTILEQNDKWIIKDDNGKEVGFIEYGPVDFDGRECVILYDIKGHGYHMVIDSDTIKYNSARDIDHQIYWFEVKGVGNVIICLGKDRVIFSKWQLRVDSDIYGTYQLHLDDDPFESGCINSSNSLIVDYSYKINGYDVNESSYFRNKDFNVPEINIPKKIFKTKKDRFEESELSYKAHKEANYFQVYDYLLAYWKKDEKQHHGEEINIWCAYDKPNVMHVTKRDLEKPMKFLDMETAAKSIEEFAIADGRGFELFNRLRKLTNDILPFKVDIFYEILKNHIEEYRLEAVIPKEEEKKLNK